MSSYPTETELKQIKEWDITNSEDLLDIAQFVMVVWNWGEPYCKLSRRIKDRGFKEGEYYRKLTLSTGGWSGNEDLIGALMQNWLWWSMCFCSHHTGGHYVFRIYEEAIKKNKKK